MKVTLSRCFCNSVLLSILWVSIASSSVVSAQSTRYQDTFAAIDRYVASVVQSGHLPGLALGIVHGDQIVHLHGFGSAKAMLAVLAWRSNM